MFTKNFLSKSLRATKIKRYELCLDGKRLTVGFGSILGDVDLYRHEAKPTLAEKKSKLEIELQVITRTTGLLEQQSTQARKVYRTWHVLIEQRSTRN